VSNRQNVIVKRDTVPFGVSFFFKKTKLFEEKLRSVLAVSVRNTLI